jgi:hypothetical protein
MGAPLGSVKSWVTGRLANSRNAWVNNAWVNNVRGSRPDRRLLCAGHCARGGARGGARGDRGEACRRAGLANPGLANKSQALARKFRRPGSRGHARASAGGRFRHDPCRDQRRSKRNSRRANAARGHRRLERDVAGRDLSPVAKRRSMLVRALPGATYELHVHDEGFEECLVLEGDFIIGDLKLLPGISTLPRRAACIPRRQPCLAAFSISRRRFSHVSLRHKRFNLKRSSLRVWSARRVLARIRLERGRLWRPLSRFA